MLCIYINICYNVDSTFNNSREHTGRKYRKLFIESLHDSNTLERQYSEKDQYSFDIVSISRPAFTRFERYHRTDVGREYNFSQIPSEDQFHSTYQVPVILFLFPPKSCYLDVLKLSPDIYITIFLPTNFSPNSVFRKIKTFSRNVEKW